MIMMLMALVIGGVGKDAPASEEDRLAQSVLTGVQAGREGLRSGVFKATGRMTKIGPEDWGQLAGDVDFFCAFDFDKNFVRFDRSEPVLRRFSSEAGTTRRKSSSPKQKLSGGTTGKEVKQVKRAEPFVGRRSSVYIRFPDYFMAWSSPWERQKTAAGIFPLNSPCPVGTSPFDVRALGLYFWSSFLTPTTFEECYDALVKSHWDEVIRGDDGMFQLRRTLASGDSYTLWVDKNQEFSPRRYEIRRASKKGKSEPLQPFMMCEVDYKEVAHTWVPSKFKIAQRQPPSLRKKEDVNDLESYDLTFEWLSVNQDVEQSMFSVDKINVPRNTSLFDYRLGKPLLVKKLNVAISTAEKKVYSPQRIVIIVNITIVLAAIIGFLIYRNRAKTQAQASLREV